MTLDPAIDQVCHHLGSYLKDGLNALDSRIVVNQVSAYDRFAMASPVDFPLLQIYRGTSQGQFLNSCEIKVEYYLLNVVAYWEQPNTLRVVEKAIAELLNLYHQANENPCVILELNTLRSSGPQYLKFSENTFPFIRIQFRCTDLEN